MTKNNDGEHTSLMMQASANVKTDAPTSPHWKDGAYYLAYATDDGWYVVYYYHGMTKADTANVWRVG